MRTLFLMLTASIVVAPFGQADDGKSKDPIPLRAHGSTDKTAIKIGERFTYTITIEANEEITTVIPDLPEHFGPFTVIDVKRGIPVIDKDGRTKAEVTCILTTYEIGKQVIPATDVKYDLKNGAHGITTTEALTIDVESVLPPEEKMKDIRDICDIYDFSPSPKEEPGRSNVFRIVLLVLLLLLAVFALVVYLHRRNVAKARLLLPHELALAELERLRGSGLIAEGKVREYYYRLSFIARRYVESRFRLRAPDRTTEEFLVELSQTDLLHSSEKALLGELLKHCDLAKFAKHRPDPSESTDTLNAVVQFVRLTKQEPEAEKGKAA